MNKLATQKIIINGQEIQGDALTTVVGRRENAIDDVTIVANDERGKTYLSQVNIGNTVGIYYSNAGTERITFGGQVVELDPQMAISGEVCTIKAHGYGIALKRQRVRHEYGSQSRYSQRVEIDSDLPVTSFGGKAPQELAIQSYVSDIQNWLTTGTTPWISTDDDDTSYIRTGGQNYVSLNGNYSVDAWQYRVNDWTHVNNSPWLHSGDSDYISMAANGDYVGYKDGDYLFSDIPTRDNYTCTKLRLWIRGALNDGPGGHADLVGVRARIIYGGSTFVVGEVFFDSTSWANKELNAISILSIGYFNQYKLELEFSTVAGGGPTKGSIFVSHVWFEVEGYGYDDAIGDQMSYFTFTDLPGDWSSETITKAILTLKGKNQIDYSPGYTGVIGIWLDTGSGWQKAGVISWTTSNTSWTYKTLDVSAYLNTYAKVNAAKIKFVIDDIYWKSRIFITYAKLYIQ